ncbi:hypothetical protein [Congregibacter litoralis]|uniref:Uncharacterized protein n=1 Tax=Congregibacter litoralis KT71 TaxID=314285 RepID=V7HVF3_9GAMM|nr:hypothetical protein [Congregibacter litoralis]ESZ89335.1 hypothetical protein KT71_002798 [Congregibacter litoralis KT71]
MDTSTPLHTDTLRVTSIPCSTAGYVIFSGVPLKKNSYRINNGKYFITIKVDASLLPVAPAIGQQWEVSGKRLIDTVESGDLNRHQFARHLSAIQNGYQRGVYEQQALPRRIQERSCSPDY